MLIREIPHVLTISAFRGLIQRRKARNLRILRLSG